MISVSARPCSSESVPGSGAGEARLPSRRGGGRRRILLWLAALAAVTLAGVAALAAGPLFAARRDLSAAQAAVDDARRALTAHHVADARAALDRAERGLNAARDTAGRFPLPLLRAVPVAGSPVRAADAGVRAGAEVVTAARILADAAASFPTSGTAAVDGHDLSGVHRAAVDSDGRVRQAVGHLSAARRELAGPAGALAPMVSRPARSALDQLAGVEAELEQADRGLALLADLTAPDADARLLIVSQDSMELRPTGGYIGSFGVLHFLGGHVELERYESFEDLPPADPPLHPPADLAPALRRPWDLSNVNWWPDFPASARAAQDMFARQGGGEVDGVIAVTEHVMARLVGLFGPISLDGYAEPVTDAGFAERVLYEVELKRPLDTPRKRFLQLLADEVFDRLFHLRPGQIPAVVDAFADAARAGDVQVWFARPEWQAAVAGTNLAGSLPAPDGDFLMLVEANLTASKANAELVRDVDYHVRRRRDGRLQAMVRIDYRNHGGETPVNRYYNGSVRLYVPRGSVLLQGGDPAGGGEPAADGPYDVFRRSVYVPAEGQASVTIEYVLPDSVDAGGYRLTWLRQAGTPADRLSATIGNRTFHADPADRRFEVAARP